VTFKFLSFLYFFDMKVEEKLLLLLFLLSFTIFVYFHNLFLAFIYDNTKNFVSEKRT